MTTANDPKAAPRAAPRSDPPAAAPGTPPVPEFTDAVDGYRQPMVTSLGVILGFLLAFLANWALNAERLPAVRDATDWVIAATLLFSTALFVTVLFRTLDNRIVPSPGLRYRATLKLYLVALVLVFLGLMTALFV